ncbi:hypothetical protein [Escherichia coli]|uniref:hypothetical protein n=1 Tax=Escherichia coli TaxID=562 RepID=UPI000D05C464|nr:hypothetical protein [Escherichia coli]
MSDERQKKTAINGVGGYECRSLFEGLSHDTHQVSTPIILRPNACRNFSFYLRAMMQGYADFIGSILAGGGNPLEP